VAGVKEDVVATLATPTAATRSSSARRPPPHKQSQQGKDTRVGVEKVREQVEEEGREVGEGDAESKEIIELVHVVAEEHVFLQM
jgi:hypothetical protein